MELKDAFEIVYQLSRAAPVVGDVGDRRDEALEVIKKLIADAEKAQEIDTKS